MEKILAMPVENLRKLNRTEMRMCVDCKINALNNAELQNKFGIGHIVRRSTCWFGLCGTYDRRELDEESFNL